MSGQLPADLRLPSLAAAKPVNRIPGPEVLPGGYFLEPKWDGFRCGVVVSQAGVTIWFRQRKDRIRWFPDLAAAFAERVPPGRVIDGPALIWTGDRHRRLREQASTSSPPCFERARW